MEKHTNIPEAATWNAADNQWELVEWDLDGAIILKRVYSQETGEVLEEHQYEDRMLWTSNVYNGSEWLQCFYHRDVEPPVISSSIL